MEDEQIKKVAELRELLEERVKTMESELQGLRALLDFINELLIEKSFKKAEEIAKPPQITEMRPPVTPVKEEARIIPLKTDSGVLMANFHVEDNQIKIIPEPNIKFNVNTPPFNAFLIEKILGRMYERDKELVSQGRLVPEKAFSYEIRKDNDVLQEIIIRNLTPQREKEVRSATRWTFERMLEKSQTGAK
ncbi:MAG: hypothetical protein QXI71_03400 [Candidatus Bathyarchaeia archaeon]|nr:hypothetical protein [Candidatus Bathyarchaeota archaeon]